MAMGAHKIVGPRMAGRTNLPYHFLGGWCIGSVGVQLEGTIIRVVPSERTIQCCYATVQLPFTLAGAV